MKLRVIVHDDFAVYDTVLAEELSAHDACLRALGGKATDGPDSQEYLRATHTYTLAFTNAVAQRADHAFRFCYLSGMGADPEETAWFPWQKQTRHLKGRTERDLKRLHEVHPDFLGNVFSTGGNSAEGDGRADDEVARSDHGACRPVGRGDGAAGEGLRVCRVWGREQRND